jgi:hypothetical protein
LNFTITESLFTDEIYQIDHPVLIIIPRPWHKILEPEKALLSKILSSVKVNIDGVLIHTQQSLSSDTLAVFKPGKVLVFGSDIDPVIRPYEPVIYQGFPLVKADDLSALDEAKKKNLWTALKQMFAV